jgi:DNA-binding NtrC family response regulator
MEADDSSSVRSCSILLVEDDTTFARIVQNHLGESTGIQFRVTWKESVESAITELSTNKSFDLIITDSKFPISSGLELALHLNQSETKIPLVFLTGSRDFKVAIEAMKLGIEDYLLKEDLPDSSLPRKIINIIDRAKMREQMQAIERRMLIAESRSQAIRELVVTVCHEFNNPLAAVKISSDLVQRFMNGQEVDALMTKFNQHFQLIEAEIKHLRDINFEQFHYDTLDPS